MAMRQQPVMVALVYDEAKGFFVGFNKKWGGYTFPMQKPRATDVHSHDAAIRALVEIVGKPPRRPEATPLEFLEIVRPSWRTGKETCYGYQVFQVDAELDDIAAGSLGSRFGFLPYADLVEADMITWSTRELAIALMENQQVALAVIARDIAGSFEYLMVRSANYNGFFLPASRLKTDTTPANEAVAAVRNDTGIGFASRIQIEPRQEQVFDAHFSRRFNQHRGYEFHICKATLPDVDSTEPHNILEQSLARAGTPWRWVSEAELADPAAHDLSPTVAVVRDAVSKVARL